MQVASVSASLRHGMTMESSIASVEVVMVRDPVDTRSGHTIVQNGSIVNLGLVVSTLGRVEPLGRLLQSLSAQVRPDDRVVLVAQDNVSEVERLAGRFRGDRFVI